MALGSSPVAVTSPSDFAPASSKEFLDIQATIECGFTLKRVRDMTRTYSLHYWFRDMVSFDFLDKDLGIVYCVDLKNQDIPLCKMLLVKCGEAFIKLVIKKTGL